MTNVDILINSIYEPQSQIFIYLSKFLVKSIMNYKHELKNQINYYLQYLTK